MVVVGYNGTDGWYNADDRCCNANDRCYNANDRYLLAVLSGRIFLVEWTTPIPLQAVLDSGTHTHARTHARTRTHAHARMHTHAQARARTHTGLAIYSPVQEGLRTLTLCNNCYIDCPPGLDPAQP